MAFLKGLPGPIGDIFKGLDDFMTDGLTGGFFDWAKDIFDSLTFGRLKKVVGGVFDKAIGGSGLRKWGENLFGIWQGYTRLWGATER